MGFLSSFIRTKVENVGVDINELLSNLDPETATEAQLKVISDALTQINGRIADLKQQLNREQKEVVEAENAIHQTMAAAELLLSQGKEDKANILIDKIEKELNPNLDREKSDVTSVLESLKSFEDRASALESKLSTARSTLENGRREMERAKLDLERAKETESQAKRDAGILKTVDSLNVASDSFAKATADAKAKAEAAKLNAASFNRVSGDDTDADIKSALDSVSGRQTPPSMSASDRLAALKAKSS